MKSEFANDVLKGLSAYPKYLSSKYFYDDAGSRIFQEIMHMPEYYLTDAEFEIFQMQSDKIFAALNFGEAFNLIELGAGDGLKTMQLVKYLISQNVDFTYIPIDISAEANQILVKKMKDKFPSLKIDPKTGDYFELLKEERKGKQPSLLLFIGSNIGNYEEKDAIRLLLLFKENMKKGDKLLLGADLKKNPLTISAAYNDDNGITKRFNLNLLQRINRELGANFQLDTFDFYSFYNPANGEVKSYIVSLRQQTVFIKKLNQSFFFKNGETIWTELSKKYSLEGLEALGNSSGLKMKQHFLDCKHYFVDTLLENKD